VKVLVTGGAGFIGANLVRSLECTPGIGEVIVLDDFSSGLRQNLVGTQATVLTGSILDESTLDSVFKGVSAVVHLAARSSVPLSMEKPMATHRANATGTAMVLEAARRADNCYVITASSSSVYGATEESPKHEALPARPISPYAASKLAAEAYTLAWSHSFGLPALVLRFFNVFGPLQSPNHAYAAVIPAFLASAFRGLPLPVHGDGNQFRDFTYVDTVTEVIITALREQLNHEKPVNLAFGGRTRLLDVVSLLEDVLDRKLLIDFQPPRPGDIRQSQADPTLLRELFPH
ncbi:uncharacterized protein METZ01_LOCUS270660, partial [marine metagenome]